MHVRTAGIVVIGNEILSGKTRDANSPYLAGELRILGVDLRKISVIPDDLSLISSEVRQFSDTFDYVFTTGGVERRSRQFQRDAVQGRSPQHCFP